MKALNAYLNFDGQAREAFRFYEGVFGGTITGIHTYLEMGMGEGADGDLVAHGSLELKDGIVLMPSDLSPGYSAPLSVGNNFSLLVDTESEEEARRLFEALKEGGEVTMDLQSTDWAKLYGECRDRYGILWSFNLNAD